MFKDATKNASNASAKTSRMIVHRQRMDTRDEIEKKKQNNFIVKICHFSIEFNESIPLLMKQIWHSHNIFNSCRHTIELLIRYQIELI